VTRPGRPAAGAWLRLAELVLFPSFCRRCGRLLDRAGERVICRDCWAEAGARRPPAGCMICGRFLEGAGELHVCRACVEARPPYAVHRSGGAYDGALKDIILLFKYRRLSVLGRGLAGIAKEAVGGEEMLWSGVEAIVPVPLHPRRKRERGFNQSRVFAGELGKLAGVGVCDGALVKVRNAPPQTSLEGRERVGNVRGAYRVKKGDLVRGRVLLLADDVYTTGATIGECARTLLDAGAKEVRAVTIARA
jgi:competence protein ComFC